MKVIVVYEEDDKGLADKLVKFVKRKQHDLTISLVPAALDQPDSLLEPFSASSHIVAILSGSSTCPPWFAFTEGFSLGSGHTLICYPGTAGYGYAPPADRFILIQDQKDLDAWLGKEAETWGKNEASRRAKQALFDMNIPFSEEALENCIRARKSQAVSHFIDAGFSPAARDKFGVPLLSLAARAGARDITELLLKAGAPVNLQAEDRGTTALIDSTAGKYREIMELLLQAGADVNLKSKDGQSALIIAVGLNDEAAVEMLLTAGANPDEPDALGVSARKYATLFNKPAVAALFNAHTG
jgi:hypothetical protein